MYFKLAFRNVHRSIKDYTIYFLTLTFGVCLFYIFNSIESQQAMIAISNEQHTAMQNLTMIMNYVSVFISIILGFLILYANKFLIKRRKKELGVYMTLGMTKSQMSLVLMLETFIIGIFSLFAGLILGLFLSQGLAVMTAKMFETTYISFQFVFSPSACGKTIVYFGLMFLLVMIFNSISISKYKLIDLLSADKQNESFKMKKLWHSVVIFILSIICLGSAYALIIKNGLMDINLMFATSLILGTIGTLFFFMSLSGFLLRIVQSNKNLYLKNLNMFVLRQLNSKINTTFISMTMICIMLLFTIGTLSSGISMADVFTKNANTSTPYDITITSNNGAFADANEQLADNHTFIGISEQLLANNIDLMNYSDHILSTIYYQSNLTMKSLLSYDTDGFFQTLTPEALENAYKEPIPLIALSDFNKQLTGLGKNPVSLNDHEFIINYDMKQIDSAVQSFIAENGKLMINGTEFRKAENPIAQISTGTSYMPMNSGTVVVPDAFVQNLSIYSNQIDFNFKEPTDTVHDSFMLAMDPLESIPYAQRTFSLVDKESVYTQGLFLKITTSYVGIYVGIIFLIASAAVLALQQLSEASDNIQRYALLRKIGAEEKMIDHALFIQVAIYFLMPLTLALVHSFVGLKVANAFISAFGDIDIASSSALTAGIIILVYGGYFIATYLGSKSMIKNRL
ncbi:MAG: ABC transporter permease [Eubacterium sp.]